LAVELSQNLYPSENFRPKMQNLGLKNVIFAKIGDKIGILSNRNILCWKFTFTAC